MTKTLPDGSVLEGSALEIAEYERVKLSWFERLNPERQRQELYHSKHCYGTSHHCSCK